MLAGGQSRSVGVRTYTVPQVRTDLRYRIASPAARGDGDFRFAEDVVLADAFGLADSSAPAEPDGGLQTWPIRTGPCHGERFNVLLGGGSVVTIEDDGTVGAASQSAGAPDDGVHGATRSEPVWQHFDAEARNRP